MGFNPPAASSFGSGFDQDRCQMFDPMESAVSSDLPSIPPPALQQLARNSWPSTNKQTKTVSPAFQSPSPISYFLSHATIVLHQFTFASVECTSV